GVGHERRPGFVSNRHQLEARVPGHLVDQAEERLPGHGVAALSARIGEQVGHGCGDGRHALPSGHANSSPTASPIPCTAATATNAATSPSPTFSLQLLVWPPMMSRRLSITISAITISSRNGEVSTWETTTSTTKPGACGSDQTTASRPHTIIQR